jgi:hypothetical protein
MLILVNRGTQKCFRAHNCHVVEWLSDCIDGCLIKRKEARREHLDYINKGLLNKHDQDAKLP